MLGRHRLVVDEWAEVYDLLRPYADETFWQWSDVEYQPTNVYILGRLALKKDWLDITARAQGNIIFCNPAEGSDTIKLQLQRLRITNLVKSKTLGLICSGDLEPGFDYLSTDVYFSNIVNYLENIEANQHWEEVYQAQKKPYDFLMLNGRLRPHRKYLIDALRDRGILQRALWTNLDSTVAMAWSSQLQTGSAEPIRLLPEVYEIERAKPNLGNTDMVRGFIKHQLFNDTWGDAIINPRAYVDSYFSVVTETIYDYPYTFRTEKIWKPMIMCHPFVVAANPGYYRDLHRAGFRTFGHLIDESFDSVDDPTDRARSIVNTVADICANGAAQFLQSCRDVCEHNYHRLVEHNQQERSEFPQKLQRYLNGRL